ncbi:hypothetical protein M5W98_30210 [Paenibacillus apiarius]|nr:hypothetical protein [Paenibacillus apiarius]
MHRSWHAGRDRASPPGRPVGKCVRRTGPARAARAGPDSVGPAGAVRRRGGGHDRGVAAGRTGVRPR